VACGPISAFGCRVTCASDGDGVTTTTYTALHGVVDLVVGRAELSSTDGKLVFEGDVVVPSSDSSSDARSDAGSDIAGATFEGRWRDTTANASGSFTLTLVSSPEPGIHAGLWVGEAAPVEELQGDVPFNPIKWCLCHRADAPPGQPAIYGVGYFDDAGDVPGQPVLFYTLRGERDDNYAAGGQDAAADGRGSGGGGGSGGGVMLKVYEPPVPEALTVRYCDMALTVNADGASVLTGRWVNELEGTAGTFTATLVGPDGPSDDE
jgi:hypothetical protein